MQSKKTILWADLSFNEFQQSVWVFSSDGEEGDAAKLFEIRFLILIVY